jgi:hypothetical protein
VNQKPGCIQTGALALILIAAVACATVARPSSAFRSVADATVPGGPHLTIVEDPKYEAWYRELEQCSGLKGDFHGLTIYESKDKYRLARTFDGYWEPNSVVVRNRWDKMAVQHEMMHDLTGSNKHPARYFQGRCGDLMRGEVI